MNGGYAMVNLGGLSTSILPATMPGIYNGVDATVKTGKMILVGGYLIGGAPVSTFPGTITGPLTEEGGENLKYYVSKLPDATIVIKENDRVELVD